jgi:hypothetical protein
VGTADSWAVSVSRNETSGRSRGRGHTTSGAAPFAPRTGSGSREFSESRGTSDSESITEGINTGTSWGVSTSRAIGLSESLGTTAQRSREFLVEAHELQQLPPSAAVISYASRAGRQVVLADANPAILTLPTATMNNLAETSPARPRRTEPAGQPVSWRAAEGRPPPNLGPPPELPDWRKHRRR